MIMGFQLVTVLTVISILCVWFRNPIIWKICYGVTLAVGLILGTHKPESVITIVLLTVLILLYKQRVKYIPAVVAALFIFAVLLGLHLMPGFNNHEYLGNTSLSEASSSFTIWFNYDKSLFGLLVFGIIYHHAVMRSWADVASFLVKVPVVFFGGIFLVYLTAFAFGYVAWDFTPSEIFFPWALKNIFFTVLAEEMLFRGIILVELLKRFNKRPYSSHLCVIITGILFGVAHFSGGVEYVILSSIAGIFYGYAYKVTGRIEAPILMHFALNAGHFIFLTYPFRSAL